MPLGPRDKRLVHIGAELRAIREDKNYTQEDMADLINVSPSTVCRFETATRIMSVDILLNYARVLGITINSLLPEEYVQRDLPKAYYKLSVDNQKVVQTTMNTLIHSLLLQQNNACD